MTRVLVVYWHPEGFAMRPSVEQHLRALERYAARGPVEYLNSYGSESGSRLSRARYDVVVLHTTFLTQRWGDTFGLFKQRFSWLADFPGLKVAIPQDEYDHPYVLDEWLYELGVEHIFTNFAAPVRALLYPILATRANFHDCLTGYIDPETAARIGTRALRQRPVDVVYRASQLPYWFGRHGQLKHTIGETTKAAAAELGLTADISMRYEDVIYGDRWFSFLGGGKSVVGAESGSSVLDRRGEIQTAIRALLAENPALTFEEVDEQLPAGWDGYELTAVSPRHFEAVLTRTPQLLVDGAYSGVLERNVHFVPISPDLSDVADALDRLADLDGMERMTARAYEDVCASGRFTYATFARELAEVVYGGSARIKTRASTADAATRAYETVAAVAGRALGLSSPTGGAVRSSPVVARAPRQLEQPYFYRDPSGPVPARRRAARGALSSSHRLQLELGRSVLRLLATNKALRSLILPAPLLGIRPRALARDLLRLAVLDQPGESATRSWTCVAERRGDALVLVSYPRGAAPPPEPGNGAVRSIVWNHAAVGSAATFSVQRPELGTLVLDADGAYAFSALSRLAARQPELAAKAFEPYGRGT